MLVAMILFDMILLALEIWLSVTWLAVTAGLFVMFLGVRVWLSPSWMINVALAVAGVSALFILSQAGQSAWGANLMLYLLPIQFANAVAAVLAMLFGLFWRVRT